MGFVNIANTNTFFIPMKTLSQSYAHMDSHDAIFENSKCYYRGGLQFLGTHFWRGQDFWAVNQRGAKIFGPLLLNNTGSPPPPSPLPALKS